MEYAHVLQGLKEHGCSNSEGMVVETFLGFTFLLRVTYPDASGEVVIELVAVFEGDVLPAN